MPPLKHSCAFTGIRGGNFTSLTLPMSLRPLPACSQELTSSLYQYSSRVESSRAESIFIMPWNGVAAFLYSSTKLSRVSNALLAPHTRCWLEPGRQTGRWSWSRKSRVLWSIESRWQKVLRAPITCLRRGRPWWKSGRWRRTERLLLLLRCSSRLWRRWY